MKKLGFILLFLTPVLLFSQNFDWIKTVGDINHDFGQWAETDSEGNIYVAGQGQGSCNFDTHIITSVNPFWFVAKYDSNGINTWVTEIPITNGYTFDMRDFKVTANGETYIVGDVNTNGSLYGMLVKIDSVGNLAKQITPSSTQNIYSITFDSNGNYYIGGVGYSGGSTVMFISKYSANDYLSWRVNFSNAIGLYNNLSLRVSADDGVIFSFLYKNTVDILDHGNGSITLNATQGILDTDRAIAKYDQNGVLLWAKTYDDSKPGRQIVVDTVTNNFYLLARDEMTDDDYLFKFNSSGNQAWGKSINNINDSFEWQFKIRINGNKIFLLGGGSSFAISVGSLGNFTCKWYDLDGNLLGQLMRPDGLFPNLGDIAFHDNTVYLVGGVLNGTWGNQVITTVHGTLYNDYFLASLNRTNIDQISSIQPIETNAQIQVYPNPTTNMVSVSIASFTGIGEVTLQDATGRTLLTERITQGKVNLDLSTIPAGFYILTYKGDHIVKKNIIKL